MRRITLTALVMMSFSCVPLPPIPFMTDADVSPPTIVGLRFRGAHEIEVGFDEVVSWVEGPEHSESVTVSTVTVEASGTGSSAVVRFADPPSPTTEHYVEGQVADEAGNHLRFVARFYGLNTMLPAMVINEFTTQGSGRHPDLVELRVLTDGNLAGATFYEGVPGDWDQRFVFPSLDVVAGDYVVLHTKPEGVPEEIDELFDREASGGNDASPTGWDFWLPDGTGLSGNNGALSLCENPLGGYIDAVLYSNRTSDSDERYRGFGSARVLARAEALAAAEAWTHAGAEIAPEDAVDPDPSTATRSIARDSVATDTNGAADWHITPTRGLSPGAPNTDDVYHP